MKTRHMVLALLALSAPVLRAQSSNFGDVPIEIEAESTYMVGHVAVAENNVVIHYRDTTIVADYAQYNPDTHDVLALGNVRIFQAGHSFLGDRAVYNLETKLLHTANFKGDFPPFFFQTEALNSLKAGEYQADYGIFTTSDSSKPDYYFKAKRAIIYPHHDIIFSNVSLYVGRVPIFWWPFYYQSMGNNSGFSILPGYDGGWGAYLLSQFNFPVTKRLTGTAHLDYRTKRGPGVGVDFTGSKYGAKGKSWATFKAYYDHDRNPGYTVSALARPKIDPNRYRIAFQSQTYFTDDLYATVDINKLSDPNYLEDFLPHEFMLNPQPDNVVALTKWSDNYTVTTIFRKQLNDFFDATERLPEVVLDEKRQPVFGSPVFYEGETGFARLSRNFGTLSLNSSTEAAAEFQDYSANRFDTFHQFLMPETVGGWLSLVPRVGFRGTYYSKSAISNATAFENLANPLATFTLRNSAQTLVQHELSADVWRPVFNAGLEASFKFSKEWEDVQSRAWGLDGLRHVVQPYANFSYVNSGKNPDGILQFDRLNPATELPSLDFPEFTATDTITDWTIMRLGVRQRLETRRDDRTMDWLTMDTFFDINLQRPNFPNFEAENGTFSNLYNTINWVPLPWFAFEVDSQIPLSVQHGFTQVNTSANFLPSPDWRIYFAHRYLNQNPYFVDTSNLTLGGYYRLSDNWGLSFVDVYEFTDHTIEFQNYGIHRDLSSWIATLGFTIRDSIGPAGNHVHDIGIVLTFSLKDFPNVSFPFGMDTTTGF